MTEEELALFRNKLIALKKDLLDQENTTKEKSETVELDQSKVGRLSRMDAMQLQQMAMEEDRRRQTQLKKIDGALNRIDSEEYGYCFVCEEEIDIRRLNFDLTATRCIKCAD